MCLIPDIPALVYMRLSLFLQMHYILTSKSIQWVDTGGYPYTQSSTVSVCDWDRCWGGWETMKMNHRALYCRVVTQTIKFPPLHWAGVSHCSLYNCTVLGDMSTCVLWFVHREFFLSPPPVWVHLQLPPHLTLNNLPKLNTDLFRQLNKMITVSLLITGMTSEDIFFSLWTSESTIFAKKGKYLTP